jgi:hypothetical protein
LKWLAGKTVPPLRESASRLLADPLIIKVPVAEKVFVAFDKVKVPVLPLKVG